MFAKYLMAFALCYLQVSHASDDISFDYDSCIANVDDTVAAYSELFQYFLIERYKWIVATNDTLTPKALKLQETDPKCAETDFVLDVFLACGGINLDDDDFLPAFNDLTTDVEGCKWISKVAPTFVAGVQYNKKVIEDCDVEETYDKIIADGFCEQLQK